MENFQQVLVTGQPVQGIVCPWKGVQPKQCIYPLQAVCRAACTLFTAPAAKAYIDQSDTFIQYLTYYDFMIVDKMSKIPPLFTYCRQVLFTRTCPESSSSLP